MHNKEILLVVQSELMFSYIIQYYDLIKGDDRLNIYFVFSDKTQISEERIQFLETDYKLKIMPSRIAAQSHWDLIIYADHGYFKPYNENLNKIYIGHGLISGAASGERNGNIYTFDYKHTIIDNKIVYKKIFVSSEYARLVCINEYPKLLSSVVNVGSLKYDQFLAILKNSAHKSESKKNILIVSTWGANSLIQFQRAKIIDQINSLYKKYNFILSLHPRNFLEECSGGIDWLKLLNDLRKLEGVESVNSPLDSISYLAKADLLITDQSSLGLYFLVADRPIIFLKNTDVPFNKSGNAYKLCEKAYRVSDLSNLEFKIKDAIEKYQHGTFKDILNKVVNHLGNADTECCKEIYSLLNINEPLTKQNGSWGEMCERSEISLRRA